MQPMGGDVHDANEAILKRHCDVERCMTDNDKYATCRNLHACGHSRNAYRDLFDKKM